MQRCLDLPEGLAQLIANKLARAIIYNDLAPNEPLREEELSLKFRVSRSPIREAFRILEQEGLVSFLPRRGVRVAPLSRQVIGEIYECRALLEGLAAARAAERITPVDIARLWRIYGRMVAAGERNDVRAYFDRNVELQNEIRALGGNSTLGRLLGGLGRQTLRYRYVVYLRAPAMIENSIRLNGEILRAIAAGDASGARRLTEHFVLEAGELLLKHLPEDLESKSATTVRRRR